jgi:precorrin-2 dehydrogenase/sirohydrochlorin ferrochelatase
MFLYPIFLKLQGHKVLIVGGGRIAEEKAEAVLRSATDVTVLAPHLSQRLRLWAQQGLVRHAVGEYRPGMARGYFLVIAATDSEVVNRSVYNEAKEVGALCNAVDDPAYCDFYAPAVVRRGDFQIAISTGGHSPALARQVRKDLEKEFGLEYAAWVEWLGRMRATLRRVLPRSGRRAELLQLLTFCRPNKMQSNIKCSGGKDERADEIGTGSGHTARCEGAPAGGPEHDWRRRPVG